MATLPIMHLYTVILDYAGGTYVSQVTAATEYEALGEWIAKLSEQQLPANVSADVGEVFERASDLVPLSRLKGVWCASADAKHDLALVNVIRTAIDD